MVILSFIFWLVASGFCLEPKPKFNTPNEKLKDKLAQEIETVEDLLFGELNLAIGARYKYGEKGGYGYDCSGLVNKIYEDLFGIKLPRSAKEIWKLGNTIEKKDLQVGDLVFFAIRSKAVDHVGISIGKDRFVHSSRRAGVIISSLNEDYYKTRFIGAKRIKLKTTESSTKK